MPTDKPVGSADPPPEEEDAPTAGNLPEKGPDPAPTRRGQRRKLQREIKEKLGSYWFSVAQAEPSPVRLVIEGDRIGTEGGNGEDVGAAIYRYSRLIRALGGEPRLLSLQFGNSVILDFQATDPELSAAKRELEEAHSLDAAATTADERAEVDAAVRRSVPNLHLAAATAAELLSVPSSEAPEAAAEYGSAVAETYRTLASAVAKAELTLILDDPASGETVKLTPTKAGAVVEELRASTEPKERVVTAFGILSAADQDQHGFGLRLDADRRKDPLLRGKRTVRGAYAPEVEASIRDNGLWGKYVRAQILVVRDAVVSTSTIRPATYTLVGVEAADG